MNTSYLSLVVEHLKRRGVFFEKGLSEREFENIESRYAVTFPDDLRFLLGDAVPISSGFPNWRDTHSRMLKVSIDEPKTQVLRAIRERNFWFPKLGPQPGDSNLAFLAAREAIAGVPHLIPIYLHRYIPDTPRSAGNPIFSVHGTDVIYYGLDLPDYLEKEFGVPNPFSRPPKPRHVDFWSDLVLFGD